MLICLFTSCKSNYNCFDKSSYEIKSKSDLINISKKTYSNQAQIKVLDDSYGIITDFFPPKIYFDNNCNGQQNLIDIEPIIGALLTDENLKIRLTGNAEKSELKFNLKISIERAEFIATILKLNGIDKSRIIILDAKSSRPGGIELESGNKENRRVDLDLF